MRKCPEQESNGAGLIASLLMVVLIVVALLGYVSVQQNEKESTTNGSESVGNAESNIEIITVPAEFCNTSYNGNGVGVFNCRFVIDIAGKSHTLYYMERTIERDKILRLQGVDKVLEGKNFEVEFDWTDLSIRSARPVDYPSIYDVY